MGEGVPPLHIFEPSVAVQAERSTKTSGSSAHILFEPLVWLCESISRPKSRYTSSLILAAAIPRTHPRRLVSAEGCTPATARHRRSHAPPASFALIARSGRHGAGPCEKESAELANVSNSIAPKHPPTVACGNVCARSKLAACVISPPVSHARCAARTHSFSSNPALRFPSPVSGGALASATLPTTSTQPPVRPRGEI